MGEHTPGPWVARECIAKCYFEIAPEQGQSDSGLFHIADVCASRHGVDGGDHIYGGEQEANANLIAAAPDLLEALEQIATGHITGAPKHTAHTSRVKSQIALKALAKAQGENQ